MRKRTQREKNRFIEVDLEKDQPTTKFNKTEINKKSNNLILFENKNELLKKYEKDLQFNQDISSSDSEDDEIEIDDRYNNMIQAVSNSQKKTKPEIKTEFFKEGEFNKEHQNKLSIEQLATAIKGDQFGKLKKNINFVTKNPLDTPLTDQEKNKLERVSGYKIVSKEISKWQPIVKKNRESQQLHFPLEKPIIEKPLLSDLSKNTSQKTHMETEIDKILEESGVLNQDELDQDYNENSPDFGLNENEINDNDNLNPKNTKKTKKNNKLNRNDEFSELKKKELEDQESKLAKIRHLMSYHAQKAKRQKKIKSKKYRKILRMEKEKNKLTIEELEKIDPNLAEKERQKLEKKRALERITLKHNNITKWAKNAKRFGKHDPSVRKAIQEQLTMNKKILEKIENSNQDEDDEEDDENEDENENENENLNDQNSEESETKKGLMGLKFMQRAMQKKKEEYQEMINQENGVNQDEQFSGRMIFGKKSEINPIDSDIKNKETGWEGIEEINRSRIVVNGPVNIINKKESNGKSSLELFEVLPVQHPEENLNENQNENFNENQIENESENESNPWIDFNSQKNQNKDQITKHIKKEHKKSKVEDDVINVQDLDENILIKKNQSEMNLENLNSVQKEIVQKAFPAEDFEAEFEREKREEIEKQVNKELGEEMKALEGVPGWGQWSGLGVKIDPKKVEEIERKRKEKYQELLKKYLSERKDSKLRSVILNNKEMRKSKKYLVESVPFPFQTKEQYETSLRVPIGKEWNTETMHDKFIQPNIVTELGARIDPIQFSMVQKELRRKQEIQEQKRMRRPLANTSYDVLIK
ncbi:u3 small nucleolar RNA-associated protein [Anaeramoeba ignava]|uniref:U3 small nucleolar RNA-associated protein n=1 Tax=Anaeramoeba ignava TaxID=1746090 RepID=A0A9Q0RIQ6_ANAIG|nr:u3 small nucleolar RNA-associated protein [Anaeramoeba ignava]